MKSGASDNVDLRRSRPLESTAPISLRPHITPRSGLGGLARAVDEHNLAGAPARHCREGAGCPYITGPDDADFHFAHLASSYF